MRRRLMVFGLLVMAVVIGSFSVGVGPTASVTEAAADLDIFISAPFTGAGSPDACSIIIGYGVTNTGTTTHAPYVITFTNTNDSDVQTRSVLNHRPGVTINRVFRHAPTGFTTYTAAVPGDVRIAGAFFCSAKP